MPTKKSLMVLERFFREPYSVREMCFEREVPPLNTSHLANSELKSSSRGKSSSSRKSPKSLAVTLNTSTIWMVALRSLKRK